MKPTHPIVAPCAKGSIGFISTWQPGWGGCEELWSRAAQCLAQQGFRVWVSFSASTLLHPKFVELEQHGIELRPRHQANTGWARIVRRLGRHKSYWTWVAESIVLDPDLIVISEAGTWPPEELLSHFVESKTPYVTITQANSNRHWLDETRRLALQPLMLRAVRTYFVSRANRDLAEHQLGCRLPNSKVVCNPWLVDRHWPPDWPLINAEDELRMACVARLHPPSKGHDLLLLALAGERWRDRKWHLSLFGRGPQQGALEAMVDRLGLTDNVSFEGHVSDVSGIWRRHHALVLASRYEGMPLALLEALVCGRPALVTAVAGNSEMVTEGSNGFVAEASSTEFIGNALERLWSRRADLRQMGARARAEILERFPLEPGEALAGDRISLLRPEPTHLPKQCQC
jgi:glycosyltransferase involved in cell wall biosynthesis